MTLEAAVDERVVVTDLAVAVVDQLTQRLGQNDVDVAQVELVEPPWPVSVEDVIKLEDHPFSAQHLTLLRPAPPTPPADRPRRSSPAVSRSI